MRIFVTALALCLIAACAFGQATTPLAKGAWMVGGDLFFQTQSGDYYENAAGDALTTFSIAPQVGYFIMPNLMIGADINFNKMSQGDDKATTLAIGPTVGYFFNMDAARTDFKGAFVPYIRGFVAFGTDKFETTTVDEELNPVNYEETTGLLQFGGQGGAMYFFSNNVAADLAIRVSSDSFSPDEDIYPNADNVSGLTLRVGVGIQAFIF